MDREWLAEEVGKAMRDVSPLFSKITELEGFLKLKISLEDENFVWLNLAKLYSVSEDYIFASDIYQRLELFDRSYEELLKVIEGGGSKAEFDHLAAYRKAEKRFDEMGYFRDGARAWDLAERRTEELESMVAKFK